jgi:hypothetical protein
MNLAYLTILKSSVFFRLLAVVALVQISVRSGEAVTISVNSNSYDVTFISGSYDANAALFNSTAMPWFGNSSLAESFASASASALDQTGWHPFSDSPLFAYDDTYVDGLGQPWETRWIFSQQFVPDDGFNGAYVRFNENVSGESQNYAVLTSAVPEPSAFFLFLAGGTLLLGFRRRAAN